VTRFQYERDLTRCEVCGELAVDLRPRWLNFGLMACNQCVGLSGKELADVYCRRIGRRE
jgi:formylmethanofuran dehydrogenase subunit E